MTYAPSAKQLATYAARSARRPVVLFYQFRCKPNVDVSAIIAALDRLARSTADACNGPAGRSRRS